MKKRLVSAACAFLFTLIIPASTAFGDDFTTPVNSGSKALLFTFSGLAYLGDSAYNGGVGFKYYVLDPLAIRGSLTFGINNQDLPAPAGGTEGNNNLWDIGLSAAAEYHLLKTRVSPYVGGVIGFTATQTENKNTANPQTTVTGGDFSFNLDALGGVEFFIIKELSLSAEYRFGYTLFAPYDTKSTTGNVTQTTKNGAAYNISINAVGALTMAFYF
jgi:hypothetical protein